ncbi:MAG TPA: hypothetical protein PLI57_00090 [Spirochaetota bacterium]|nr:hypothetical protein [Spirochaetota bacterium]
MILKIKMTHMGFNLTHMDVAPLPDGKIDAYDTDKQRGTLYCFKNLTHMRRALIKNAPYVSKKNRPICVNFPKNRRAQFLII